MNKTVLFSVIIVFVILVIYFFFKFKMANNMSIYEQLKMLRDKMFSRYRRTEETTTNNNTHSSHVARV